MSEDKELAAGTLPPDNELDFSGDGFETPRVNWLITEAEIVETEGGKKQVACEFEAEVNGVVYTVKQREWIAHPTAQAQAIGRGNMKRLAKAATGEPKLLSLDALKGRYVSAEGYEDKQGFRKIGRFNAPEVEAKAVETPSV